MSQQPTNNERDSRVLELYEKIIEIEQRLIPTGLHIFGGVAENHQLLDLLRMVASFDRPELGIGSLTGLIAEGLKLPDYQSLIKDSGSSEQYLMARERVEAIAGEAINKFLIETDASIASA